MKVLILSPSDEVMMSKLYGAEGNFSFTSHIPGEHKICLQSNTSSWFSNSGLRIHFDIQYGELAFEYVALAYKEKLTELQLRVRQLLNQVEQITKEQRYQRFREEWFRYTSESTRSRVLWWSVSQTIVLVLIGFWQMINLKRFFEAKKLV